MKTTMRFLYSAATLEMEKVDADKVEKVDANCTGSTNGQGNITTPSYYFGGRSLLVFFATAKRIRTCYHCYTT